MDIRKEVPIENTLQDHKVIIAKTVNIVVSNITEDSVQLTINTVEAVEQKDILPVPQDVRTRNKNRRIEDIRNSKIMAEDIIIVDEEDVEAYTVTEEMCMQ